MKILSKQQWEAILFVCRQADKEILELKEKNKYLEKEKHSLSDRVVELNLEISRLRYKLNKNGLTWTESGIDFPLTKQGK